LIIDECSSQLKVLSFQTFTLMNALVSSRLPGIHIDYYDESISQFKVSNISI
jgi:tRNA A37 threonylcarbamoyladenosine biosynthesis protein TsaE